MIHLIGKKTQMQTNKEKQISDFLCPLTGCKLYILKVKVIIGIVNRARQIGSPGARGYRKKLRTTRILKIGCPWAT